jgi:single-stranded-DNA-specific exonuclease
MKPSREEMVYIYKVLQAAGEISLDDLFMRLANPVFNYCKLRLIADVFCEAGLARLDPSTQRVSLIPVKAKADLEATATMQRLDSLLNG